MQRFQQILFTASLVALNWFAMMAVHELGHFLGAILSGGRVDRVVLYPFTISRTDVVPNPHPAIVAWLGPIVGCLVPLALAGVIPHRHMFPSKVARFFAGFCLVANGAYISVGSFYQLGDCGDLLRAGSPRWTLLAFGAITIPGGLYLWHRLGSLKEFTDKPSLVTARMAYVTCGVLIILIAAEYVLSPR